jgi:hypothetical protein
MRDTYSIVVTVNGKVARKTNGADIETANDAPGEYTVTFPEPIDTWLWLATLGPSDTTPQAPGVITVQLETMTTDTLRVKTYNFVAAAPAATDRPFHLHVRRMNA